MTTSEQFQTCAEMDGYYFGTHEFDSEDCWRNDHGKPSKLPTYDSYDVLIPLVRKMKPVIGNNQDMFVSSLWRIMKLKPTDCTFELLLATPSQLREALLRSVGKWKVD